MGKRGPERAKEPVICLVRAGAGYYWKGLEAFHSLDKSIRNTARLGTAATNKMAPFLLALNRIGNRKPKLQ